MKLLQINVTANWGSTGRIAEDIGKTAISKGWESWIAYGQRANESCSHLIRIGSKSDIIAHGVQSRLFDRHGLASKQATLKFIKTIKDIKPDIIHLHNIHGYYLHYPLLFDFLKEYGRPVVWTLHDCWAFTGHCAYYDYISCDKWKSGCQSCPQIGSYPASLFLDRSNFNFEKKKEAFSGLDNLTLVPVSEWLDGELKQSFLKNYPSLTIHNGIDMDVFKPYNSPHIPNDKKQLLGVASVWEKRKGLPEFFKLRKLLPDNFEITIVGLNKNQIKSLPDGIKGIHRTENLNQLVELYYHADVFVNPTFEDNFPTSNLEALACGTPVVTYATGGSPEAIDSNTGLVVAKGDVEGLKTAIFEITSSSEKFKSRLCRERAVTLFNKKERYEEYMELYDKLLTKK